MGGAEDGGGFGHKVDAAEHDVAGLWSGRRLLGQQEGIALEVGVLDYLFPLVVVAQDGNAGAQLLPHLVDTGVQFRGGAAQVLGGNLLPPDVDRQFLGQGPWPGSSSSGRQKAACSSSVRGIVGVLGLVAIFTSLANLLQS